MKALGIAKHCVVFWGGGVWWEVGPLVLPPQLELLGVLASVSEPWLERGAVVGRCLCTPGDESGVHPPSHLGPGQ